MDPAAGLGPLCHCIYLNPVRAKLRPLAELPEYPWTSLRWLMHPKERPAWYDPRPALAHAGSLADTPAGRRNYLEYLAWLAEDEPARKAQRFEQMSRGWVIGSGDFAKEVLREYRQLDHRGRSPAADLQETREALWREELSAQLKRAGRTKADVASAAKSADWKLAIAAALKAKTTVSNRWLAEHLNMGGLHEVSRRVNVLRRATVVRR
ncbi:MAG: hypothetical protein JSS11_09045 [Verrucomicrobia bacterium]|nr:hypothetical protein [Verrucomicrobiota bacterium]